MGWGMIYLSFNAVRAIEIVRDRTSTTESLGFNEDEMSVYASKFHKHMPPRRFQALLRIAEWREVEPGTAALDCQSECGLLVRGQCSVSKHGETLLVVNEGMFLAVPHLEDSVDHQDNTEGVLKNGKGGAISGAASMNTAVVSKSTSASVQEGSSDSLRASANVNACVGQDMPIEADRNMVITAPATSQSLSGSGNLNSSETQPALSTKVTSEENNSSQHVAVSSTNSDRISGSATVVVGSVASGTPTSATAATTTITISSGSVAAVEQMATVQSLERSLVLVWPLAALRAHWLTQDESAAASLLRVFHDGLVEQTQARDHVFENEKYASLLRRFVFYFIQCVYRPICVRVSPLCFVCFCRFLFCCRNCQQVSR